MNPNDGIGASVVTYAPPPASVTRAARGLNPADGHRGSPSHQDRAGAVAPDSVGIQGAESAQLITDLRARVARARSAAMALAAGQAVLVADDGSRENEVDFVFHAAAASTKLVNTAINACRGLLCVSLSATRADALGLVTAPRTASDIPLTGFTLSVDAREGIGSGISAADRAHTIALLGNPSATPQDFVTPGHVFPVRAVAGLLCRRTGHTEAVLELCRLAGLIEAAAMCECLGDDGAALSVAVCQSGDLPDQHPLKHLAFVSTVDLLWVRLLLGALHTPADAATLAAHAEEAWHQNLHTPRGQLIKRMHGIEVDPLLFPYAIWLQPAGSAGGEAPEQSCVTLEWVGSPVGHSRQIVVPDAPRRGVALKALVFAPELECPLPDTLGGFCDLSAKDGLGASSPAARRVLTHLAVCEGLAAILGEVPSPSTAPGPVLCFLIGQLALDGDRDFVEAIFDLRRSP